MKTLRQPSAHRLYLVLFAAAAWQTELSAQPAQLEGRRIVSIQFIPPRQPLEPSELHEILPLKRNTPLKMDTVRASIERLYGTGRYEDIQVDAEPVGNDVVIRFITRNSWFVGRVATEGKLSDPPNAGQLANASRLDLGEPFDESKLSDAVAGVKRLLEGNGLYEGDVQPRLTYDDERQQVNISFVVNSGRRARFTTPLFKGELKAEPEKLIAATKFRRWIIHTWKPITQIRVRNGVDSVRSFYQKRDRLEAKVTLESLQHDADTNTARPALEIFAGPKVEVKTVGAGISKKTLRSNIPIYEEHAIDRDLLVEGQRNLANYLQSRGYFEAEVEFKQQRVTNDQAAIDYLVNTGKRHKLVHIDIQGNKYFSRDNITERMFLRTSSLLQFRHGRYSDSLLRRDQESIANLYKANGFRDVSVNSRMADDYQGKVGQIAVFLTIDEGPQTFVHSLEVTGIRSLNKEALLATLSSAAGQPFSEFNVAVDRDTILAQYFANGFPNATFEWSSTPTPVANQVDLKFVIAEGQQQFVREVLISGLKATRPSLVHKNLLLNPGDPLSPVRMTDAQRRLYDLGVFAKVETAIQNPEGQTQRKYVLYQMDEAKRYSITAGLGAEVAKIGGCQGCLDAPGGQAGFAPRVSLDVTRFNMFGLGHSLSFRSRASTLDRRGLINYSAPRYRNREGLNLSFTGLYDDARDVRTFASKRLEFSTQLSQRWSKATTLFYRYSYRRVSVDQNTLKISPLLVPSLAAVRLGMLSVNAVQDRRDDPAETHKGVYNTIDLGLAERIFGSQRNFLRFLGRNTTYHPFGRRYVVARTTSFGVLHAFRFDVDPFQAIPLPERFFAGGGASHRGFPENQAGPRDTITGFPLGGTALLFNQTEFRFPLIGENIGGVFFHDVGNAYSSPRKISFRMRQKDLTDFDYLVHAAGFGVRYRTPIGPVRVDLAYSINPPTFFGFKGTRAELFSAGATPCAKIPGQPLSGRCVVQNISHFQFFFSIGQTF